MKREKIVHKFEYFVSENEYYWWKGTIENDLSSAWVCSNRGTIIVEMKLNEMAAHLFYELLFINYENWRPIRRPLGQICL